MTGDKFDKSETNMFSLIQQIHQTIMDNSAESLTRKFIWIYSCRIGSSDPIGRVECGYNRKGELQQTFFFFFSLLNLYCNLFLCSLVEAFSYTNCSHIRVGVEALERDG